MIKKVVIASEGTGFSRYKGPSLLKINEKGVVKIGQKEIGTFDTTGFKPVADEDKEMTKRKLQKVQNIYAMTMQIPLKLERKAEPPPAV